MINDYTYIFYSHQAPQCNKYTMNCVEFKRRGRDRANSICMNSVHIEKKSNLKTCGAPHRQRHHARTRMQSHQSFYLAIISIFIAESNC